MDKLDSASRAVDFLAEYYKAFLGTRAFVEVAHHCGYPNIVQQAKAYCRANRIFKWK